MRDSTLPRLLLPLLVTLPSAVPIGAGAPPPEILLFADGFESGDTAAWAGIGAGGGRIVADGGRVVLDFPPGAVEVPTPVTVTPVTPAPPDFVEGTVYELGPGGVDFLLPVRLEIEYDPAVLIGPEDELAGAVLEASGDRARDPSSPVDTVADRVVSQIDSFSEPAVELLDPRGDRARDVPLGGSSVRGVAYCNGPCFGPPDLAATYNADRSVTLDWTLPPVAGLIWQIERARMVAGDPCVPGSSPYCIDDGAGGGTLNGLQPPRASDWALRVQSGIATTTWTDFVGAQGGVFWYRIRWRVGNGSTTSWSNPVRVIVFGLQPAPPRPTGFTASSLPCGGVALQWQTVFEASGYTLARAPAGGMFQTIATVAGTDYVYYDTSSALVPGETYSYRIRGFNGTGPGPSAFAAATNADAEFTIGLPVATLAVPPGGSSPLDVLLFRHDDPNLDIDLDAVFDLPGFSASFSPDPAGGNSVATISVDPAASPGLIAAGRITGTSLPPGSGASCSIWVRIRAREPGCSLQIPDVSIPPFVTAFTDVVIDRWGFAGGVDLSEDGSLAAQGVFSTFIPDPATHQSSMTMIFKGGPQPPPFVATGTVQAAATDGSGVGCQRQFELTVQAP